MSAKNPGARARALGSLLRECRDACGFTVRAAAEAVGWDKSTLSRIERGSRQPALEEVGQLLGTYRVAGDTRDDILQMTRSVTEPGWWEHGDRGLARATAALASYEAEARALVDWSPLLVPGFLQTAEYAHSWMLADGVAPETAESRTRARMRRQRVLLHDTFYTAYIGEPSLCTSVGDGATMARQLAAIRQVAGWSNVSVRVVPSSVGAHRGQVGPFHLMEFPDVPAVVLIELLGSSLFMDEPWQTEPYLETATQLANVALGETESARLITKMQARWSERAGAMAQIQS